MKFYGRNQEIERLWQLDRQSEQTAVFTLLIGRRRTGKTTLVKQAFADKPMLYFFVSQKSEQLLCQELQQKSRLYVRRFVGHHGITVSRKGANPLQNIASTVLRSEKIARKRG